VVEKIHDVGGFCTKFSCTREEDQCA
jgi:hypothetical protein